MDAFWIDFKVYKLVTFALCKAVTLIKEEVMGFADLIKETLLLFNGVYFYKLIYSFCASCFADAF